VAPDICQVTVVSVQLSVITGGVIVTTALQLPPFVFSRISAGQLVITGGMLSPVFTSAVVCELHPFAVAVIVKMVFRRVAGALLFIIPETGVPLPLSNPVNSETWSLVHVNCVPDTLFGFEIII
jgi:hypothetical protein